MTNVMSLSSFVIRKNEPTLLLYIHNLIKLLYLLYECTRGYYGSLTDMPQYPHLPRPQILIVLAINQMLDCLISDMYIDKGKIIAEKWVGQNLIIENPQIVTHVLFSSAHQTAEDLF